MGVKTNIPWCDSTINPTSGCIGCELWNGRDIRHCYAGNWHENLPPWARRLRDDCIDADIPFFFKQWGCWAPITYVNKETGKPMVNISVSENDRKERVFFEPGNLETAYNMKRMSVKNAGAVLDGKEWKQFPPCNNPVTTAS